jgi:hypothetical protein
LTGASVSIRLDPAPSSIAMARIFVASILGAAGVDPVRIEDSTVLVSDVATVLVGHGELVALDAAFGDGKVTLTGNLPDMLPEAGAMLLGDAFRTSNGQWALTLEGS